MQIATLDEKTRSFSFQDIAADIPNHDTTINIVGYNSQYKAVTKMEVNIQ
ncbi:hypothetical protein [Listeria newyorkensis]|uniref:Uncharacterized protein n=1 Tax=Listeria newyorkensis TaxID=1497681 RepID=A0A841Z1J6_9LIST|nr:hypothetical protein [Listeria newyorkensis]MBC1459012.1 hypothetical protein [Listeria newyorkensis]